MEKICNHDTCNEISNPGQDYCEVHQKSVIKKAKLQLIEEELQFVESLKRRVNLDKIIISTGDINSKYSIIDTIMVFDNDVAGIIEGVNPQDAFELVKEHMRAVAVDKGGNAVINCQFQFRFAATPGLLGYSQVFEIYAYGTLVRINEE